MGRQDMGTDRPWAQTGHGHRQAMGTDGSWTQTGHGHRHAMGRQAMGRQVMGTDRPWTQTGQGQTVQGHQQATATDRSDRPESDHNSNIIKLCVNTNNVLKLKIHETELRTRLHSHFIISHYKKTERAHRPIALTKHRRQQNIDTDYLDYLDYLKHRPVMAAGSTIYPAVEAANRLARINCMRNGVANFR